MKTNPITFASKAKGLYMLTKRVHRISQRYGIKPEKIDNALWTFAEILDRFDCGASFPLTAVVLERQSELVARYLNRNIEFVVHGYTHIDYSQLEPAPLFAYLQRARKAFAKAGINTTGFRSPYLRRNPSLYKAIKEAGFLYASNQPVLWEVLDEREISSSAKSSYWRALELYEPWDTSKRLSLPRLVENIVEIPVSLPDDEILLDRLDGERRGLVGKAWRRILAQTYHLGELFTIQLHPERIGLCAEDLATVLTEARGLTPSVWLTRMDEVATWWLARAATSVDVKEIENCVWEFRVDGPPGVTILARGVETVDAAELWAEGYRQVIPTPRAEIHEATITVHATSRPCIGISPTCSPAVADFLQQQGYVFIVGEDDQRYSIYIDLPHFIPEDERTLITRIEQESGPLVRLGRWPNGARSAVCVTGDIDAFTLWDYGMRLIGK